MSIEIPLSQALTVEQAIAAATAAKIAAQQALADIPAVIDAEVGPASAPYIAQAESARDAAVVAKTVAETARDNALATERRMRQQSLGQFANDAAAEAWAAAQSPAITIITGTSYLNTTTDIFRYAVVTAGPTITWHDVTEDEAAQAALATASATAAQNALSDFLTKYIGPFNSTPTYVGDNAPWSIGALYWNSLQGKFYIWTGAVWAATDATAMAAALDAASSRDTALAIAAGLSASTYTLDGIDAQRVGALFSAPKGLFMLNGTQVPLSSLLSFSSAAKYTVGPDGNYILNSANSPAWDWSTGRRRLLIEANGVTNYSTNSEDLSTLWTPGRTSASLATNALCGLFNLTTLTSLDAIMDNRNCGAISFSGDKTLCCTLRVFGDGNIALPEMGIYEPGSAFGSSATVRARVLSGPGNCSVSASGVVDLTGLSLTEPTYVEICRTFTGMPATTAYAMFYANWSAAGQVLKLGTPQFTASSGASSYTPCGASPTARAADVVTAASGLLALLTAANATFAMRYTNPNAPNTAGIIGSTSGPAMVLDWDANTGAVLDNAAANVLSIPGATATNNRGLAVSYTAGSIKATLNGASAVKVAGKTLFSASDSGIQLCKPYASIYGGNFAIDEMIVWPILASDAGLQAQARVYS